MNNSVRYTQIVERIKGYLTKENSIAFLQEIPCKKVNDGKWTIHPLFKKLQRDFKKDNYTILCNDTSNNGYLLMMTIVIAVKDSVTQATNKAIYPNNIPTNRECAVMFHGLNILGIHAKNGKDNDPYLKSLNDQADILLGDFSAGNYTESKNRFTFNNILKEHVCICNTPTRVDPKSKRRTCIDHIFVRNNLVSRCANMRVHENITLSDHFPLTFEMTVSS